METNKRHIIDELKKNQSPLPEDAFFDKIKSDILQRIETETAIPAAKVIPLYRRMWFVASIAAGVALLLSIPVLFRNEQPQQTQQAEVTWDDVSREEMLAYIDENIDDFDEELLAQHLDSIPHTKAAVSITHASGNILKKAKQKAEKKEKNLFENIDKEDILEYLEEEAIDLDDELF